MPSKTPPENLKLRSSFSLLIPAFNEENSLPAFLRESFAGLKEFPLPWEILCLDDRSTDNTYLVLQELKKEFPALRIFSHPQNLGAQNLGVGKALITLFAEAKNDYLFFLPADGQVKAGELYKFLPLLSRCQLVVGWRKKRADSLLRKILSKAFNLLFFAAFKIPVKDADSVFLVKKEITDSLSLNSRGALLLPELLVKAQKAGYTIGEVEIKHYPRTAGKAKGLSFKMVKTALKEFRRLFREQKCR